MAKVIDKGLLTPDSGIPLGNLSVNSVRKLAPSPEKSSASTAPEKYVDPERIKRLQKFREEILAETIHKLTLASERYKLAAAQSRKEPGKI